MLSGIEGRMDGWSRYGKRLFDIATVVAATPVAALLGVLVAVAVGLRFRGKILFLQERAGYMGAPFQILKFRTMTDDMDTNGHPLADEKRLTLLGRCLRATSLDELPQLLNVLRGDMSLVGPRPLYVRYLERYSSQEMRRIAVRPGITGWAQVNGRNAVDWEQRLRLDVWYVDHCSLALDLRILLLTIMRVFGRHGISAEGHATMPEYRGTASQERKAA